MADSNSNHKSNSPNPEELDEKAVDPRDLVYKGGYDKPSREIVENPAVAPGVNAQLSSNSAAL